MINLCLRNTILNRSSFLLSLAFWVAVVSLVPAQLESRSEALPKKYWKELEPGLELGSFVPSRKSQVGDSVIRVLRIDLGYFEFRLLNASAKTRGQRKSVRDWVNENGLIAGINASMYQQDNLTSVSYMKTGNHVNSSWVSKDRTFLAFDPKSKSLPSAKIFDRDCEDFEETRKHYRSLVQSIRMVSCDGKNVWEQQKKKWSIAALGMDSKGRMLFMHVRSPYSTHDFINILLDLPIDLKRAMYVEGGKDAQLYINTVKEKFEFVGNYSTGVNNADSTFAWPVPNVLGIVRTPRTK
jgi:phosphodiester glycosidase